MYIKLSVAEQNCENVPFIETYLELEELDMKKVEEFVNKYLESEEYNERLLEIKEKNSDALCDVYTYRGTDCYDYPATYTVKVEKIDVYKI